MSNSTVNIRRAQGKDCAVLVELMRALAEFEGYGEHFQVSESILEDKLINQESFSVLVAECEQQLVGMLAYYYLPFTYDLTPWIYIKELYVIPNFRSKNIGLKLMIQLARECKLKGGKKIRWDVLSTNLKAQKFYHSLGARQEQDWFLFSLSREDITRLAASVK